MRFPRIQRQTLSHPESEMDRDQNFMDEFLNIDQTLYKAQRNEQTQSNDTHTHNANPN